jgi:hypothetical protein
MFQQGLHGMGRHHRSSCHLLAAILVMHTEADQHQRLESDLVAATSTMKTWILDLQRLLTLSHRYQLSNELCHQLWLLDRNQATTMKALTLSKYSLHHSATLTRIFQVHDLQQSQRPATSPQFRKEA